MPPLARRNLFHDKIRLAVTLTGITFAVLLVVVELGSGESVSNSSTVPDPIVTIGDNSVLRVRVDVDETEVAQVRVGQPAYVTADAYRAQKFTGRVIRVGNELGTRIFAPT